MLSLLMPSRKAFTGQDYSPLSDFWYGPAARQVAAGVTVTPETALTYSAVWACTRLLAATTGRLPINKYRRRDDGTKSIDGGDPRNMLVFRKPNSDMTPMMWKAQAVAQQVNAGNAYSEIQRTKQGDPFALWPIHQTRVKPVLDEKTESLHYRVRNKDGSFVDIAATDMLHFPSMMSDDGITGKGVLTYARESVGLGLALTRNAANVFGNGGIPRVVIESPKKWSPESRLNFRKEWREIYGGPEGDKVGVMDEGSKLHVLGVSQEDLQAIGAQQNTVEDFARWYGVPPHKIQQLLRSTFSNIEHQSLEFITDSLIPWIVLIEEELDRKLLTAEELSETTKDGEPVHYFAFKVLEYLRGDTVTRGEYWNKMVNSGIASRNQARISEDMNPVEGGDTFLVQGAMVALDEGGKPMPGANAPQPGQPPAKPDETKPTDEAATEDATDEPPADDATATATKVLRIVLQDTLARMIRKETTAARRAANKPGEFLKWMDEFYGKHQEQIAESLAFAERAAVKLSLVFVAELAASRLVEQSKAALLQATETTADKFAAAIESLMTEWETNRAAEIVREFFNRNAGGPGSGPHPGGGKHPPEQKANDRAARAKASHNPSSKEKQDASEKFEISTTKKLGGIKSSDNKPIDITVDKRHGVELKALHDAKEHRVNMRKDSRQRKEAWQKEEPGRTLHTVAIDNRDKFAGGAHASKYSGHTIYHKAGVGAFALSQMTKVKSFAHLKSLIRGGK